MIIGYFVIRILPIFFGQYIETETVVRETFIDKIETKGIILKDEFVYTDNATGMDLLVEDGDRVRKGEALAQNTDQEAMAGKAQEISEVDERVSQYRSAYMEYDGIIEGTVGESITDYMTKIEDLFTAEELELIEKDLEEGLRSSNEIFESKVVDLESRREMLQRGMQDSMLAAFPGVVSYNVDGLEDSYDFNDIDGFGVEDYDKLEKRLLDNEGDKVSSGLKIVENNLLYVAVKLDPIYEKDLRSREKINVEFIDAELSVTAKVRSMSVGESEMLLILEVTEGIHRIQGERYPRLSLIKGSYEGLKIPSSALTESGGVRGVYIKDISGVVKFVPIRLLYKGRDYSIVNEDDSIEVVVDGEKSKERSLKVFDEVFKNSILVKEGQIVD